jgi:hypothetical protein
MPISAAEYPMKASGMHDSLCSAVRGAMETCIKIKVGRADHLSAERGAVG